MIVKEVAGWGNTFVGEFDRESYDGVLVDRIRECFYIIFWEVWWNEGVYWDL